MRIHSAFPDVNPTNFLTNFDSQFSPEQQMLEFVRNLSEQEAEKNRVKNKACSKAVASLPVIMIEEKHCKVKNDNVVQGNISKYITQKAQQKTQLEPPTCTICVEFIQIGNRGMFMPCGHIYHPDCLKPWFETNNSCPVCRYEIPKDQQPEDPSKKVSA
mmetsp:Transcript_18356/g.31384  ORF Transcript_18356/g.31384 Transcript_18356/m.31384 type:complete len:159 (-) Transcript_18356:64-540(-)